MTHSTAKQKKPKRTDIKWHSSLLGMLKFFPDFLRNDKASLLCRCVASPSCRPPQHKGELKVSSFHLDLYLVAPGSTSQLTATDNMETCQLISHHSGHSLLASPLHRKWKQESMREEQRKILSGVGADVSQHDCFFSSYLV